MNNWISVKDKMPNEGEIVMTYGSGAANTQFCQAYYRANGFWQELDECGDFLDDSPTHWMPLPEPPRADNE